jgi:hypothetical protein
VATKTPTSNLTLTYLLEKYGLTLGKEALAEVFHMEPVSIINAVSSGVFPVPTFRLGSKRYAHVEDVANHLNTIRKGDTHG